MNQQRVIQIIVALFLVAAFSPASAAKTRKVREGNWGGQHINVKVTGDSATVDFDCASGTIEGPLTIDSKGHFKLNGTHTQQRGGPIRRGDSGNAHPALYTGSIKGQVMTVTIKLTDTNETVGTYKLFFGRTGKIFRCM